jgi:hypothetical protein
MDFYSSTGSAVDQHISPPSECSIDGEEGMVLPPTSGVSTSDHHWVISYYPIKYGEC